MRPRFNRNAICSSQNYKASRKAHLRMLQERHEHFDFISITSHGDETEVSLDVPRINSEGRFDSGFRTVRIFGKEIRLTSEEYKTHYAKCNF